MGRRVRRCLAETALGMSSVRAGLSREPHGSRSRKARGGAGWRGHGQISDEIIVGVAGDRILIVTALHVLAGDDSSGVPRGGNVASAISRSMCVSLASCHLPATMSYRWNRTSDLSALRSRTLDLASSVAIAFGVSSPVTLERPYAAEVIGQGGRTDWRRTSTRASICRWTANPVWSPRDLVIGRSVSSMSPATFSSAW